MLTLQNLGRLTDNVEGSLIVMSLVRGGGGGGCYTCTQYILFK